MGKNSKKAGPIPDKEFGTRLKLYRKNHTFSQQEVADFLGIDRTTYTKYESGRKADIDTLVKLCELYSITPNDLLRGLADFSENREKDGLFCSPEGRTTANGTVYILSAEETALVDLYRSITRKAEVIDFARKTLIEEEATAEEE